MFIVRQRESCGCGADPTAQYSVFKQYSTAAIIGLIFEMFETELEQYMEKNQEETMIAIIVKNMLTCVLSEPDEYDQDTEFLLTQENEKGFDISMPERKREYLTKESLFSRCEMEFKYMNKNDDLMKFQEMKNEIKSLSIKMDMLYESADEFDDVSENEYMDNDKNYENEHNKVDSLRRKLIDESFIFFEKIVRWNP
jgi:hypothetical protein